MPASLLRVLPDTQPARSLSSSDRLPPESLEQMLSVTSPGRSASTLRRLGGSGRSGRRGPISALDVLIIGGVLATIGGLVVSCAGSRPIGNPRVPEPAKPVDISRYLGRWYEIARYDSSFERDCEGVAAEYSLRPDGMIRVLNICHKASLGGRVYTAEGKARVVPGSHNSKLKVSFFGPFFFGDYWILDHAEDYSWSIVGEPSGKYLWLLCREATPAEPVKAAMLRRVSEIGYDTSMLRMTQQSPE
jgi:apolipoprotein D and lipocalin family protein